MLIDLHQKYGLDTIAQTNLDLRIHRNQEVASLGKMSFGILQTFWNRLARYKGQQLTPESLILSQMASDKKNYDLLQHEIKEKERQPMSKVKEYQKLLKKVKKTSAKKK